MARRDSNASAKAAGKSAREAEQAKKIARGELLSPHFTNLDCLVEHITASKSPNIVEINAGKKSMVVLSHFLLDADFNNFMNEIENFLNKSPRSIMQVRGNNQGNEDLSNLRSRIEGSKEFYNEIKNKYLNIVDYPDDVPRNADKKGSKI
jgi:hypothetical protein